MAETVQVVLELMVPELEDLQRRGFFSEVRRGVVRENGTDVRGRKKPHENDSELRSSLACTATRI
jgi:hypothetical protein